MMKGFMGRTHALLSIMLICICMLIPLGFFKSTIWLAKTDILFFIVSIIVTSGGALLPDLDNCQSSAGHTLGPVGSIFTTFMQTISSIMWNLLHKKGDRPPETQHRYFWHTLICGIGIVCMFVFGIKGGEQTIIESIKTSGNFATWIQGNIALMFFILLIFGAVLVGSDMVIGKIIKFFKAPKILNYILPALITIYIFVINMTKIKILGITLGLGYIFHAIEDCFADSGVPILWPIPIKGQMWKRIKFLPVPVKTGSLVNSALDLVVFVIDIILIFLVFYTKTALPV